MVLPSARRQDHSITSESPLKLCSWYFQHLQAEKICFGPQTVHIDRVKLNVLPTILTNFSFFKLVQKVCPIWIFDPKIYLVDIICIFTQLAAGSHVWLEICIANSARVALSWRVSTANRGERDGTEVYGLLVRLRILKSCQNHLQRHL